MADRLLLGLVFLLCFAAPRLARAREAVLVLPVQAAAFSHIEAGLRRSLGDALRLRVVLANDYRGKPGGAIEAAVAGDPVAVMPLGTALCQAFLAAGEARAIPPLLCVAVTNPRDVLPEDQIAPPRRMNVTVIPEGPPATFPGTADLIARLHPRTKAVGTIYNPGEANSVSNRDRIRQEASRLGWTLIEKTVREIEDVPKIAEALLAERPDAIWISTDRVMTSNPESLIERAYAAGIPVYATDAGTVERFAALGTRSVSFEQLGAYVGRLALETAGGKMPAAMPISTEEDTRIFLSEHAMRALNLDVPADIKDTAVVYQAPLAKAASPVPLRIVGGIGAALLLIALFFVLRRRSPRSD